jgi:hypothetical protein
MSYRCPDEMDAFGLDCIGRLLYTQNGDMMQNTKLSLEDLDAVAEAERFGALAISRSSRNRGAKMTKYGLTTAQLRVLKDSASNLVYALKGVKGLNAGKKKVHVGKMILELTERGNTEIVEIRGMKRALAHR